jgi:hypothetical protein
MNTQHVTITLPNGLEAHLMFRQLQPGGDWICQATAECMFDLQTLLEGGNVVDTVQ